MSKTKRERRRQAQREAIVTAAKEIARRDGWRDLTIRKIADVVAYAPPIVYQHFASKEALLRELLVLGFREVNCRLRAALEAAPDAYTAILRLAETVVNFAAKHPELYQVMHGLDGVPFGTDETPAEARKAFHTARAALQSLAEDRAVALYDVDGRVDTLWAVLHGFISLDMAHRIKGGAPRVKQLLLAGVESLLSAWGLSVRGATSPKDSNFQNRAKSRFRHVSSKRTVEKLQ